jgi:hypothetical protein
MVQKQTTMRSSIMFKHAQTHIKRPVRYELWSVPETMTASTFLKTFCLNRAANFPTVKDPRAEECGGVLDAEKLEEDDARSTKAECLSVAVCAVCSAS